METTRFKISLKRTLTKGMETGVLIRPGAKTEASEQLGGMSIANIMLLLKYTCV